MGKMFAKGRSVSFLFILLFVLLFVGIRLFNLTEGIGFGTDQGRDFLTTLRMFESRQLVFLGPPSQYTVDGRAFFFGPAPYYVMLPGLLIGNWDPLFASYYLIVLNALVILTALAIFIRQLHDRWVAYFFAFLTIFTPVVIMQTRSYWNPHFMFPVATLLVALLLLVKQGKQRGWLFFIVGFLFGLGLQFHYSFVFAIGVSLLWLLLDKRIERRVVFPLIGGFVVGFLPVIAYELKNNFYNIRTLLLVFTSPASSQNQLHVNGFYYFISLLPFVFFIASFGLSWLRRIYPVLLVIVLGLYAMWGIMSIYYTKQQVLDYATLQTLAQEIEADRPTHFNIVDQLTRDNQAMALRYVLTAHGVAPLREGEYAEARTLYIYSKEPLPLLLENPVYEIKSFLPFHRGRIWHLEDGMILYRLEK